MCDKGVVTYELLVTACVVPVTARHVRICPSPCLDEEREAHWWVFTMAVRLILPLLMASFKTGATLSCAHQQRALYS